MHLLMLVFVFTVSGLLRWPRLQPTAPWSQRWSQALHQFLLPPILLLTTAGAILWMGPDGATLTSWDGWFAAGLAWGLLGLVLAWGLYLSYQGWSYCQQLTQLPVKLIGPIPCRLVISKQPLIAQVGFWRSQVLVSQGLLNQLTAAHLQAVLHHEQAHAHYRDTFWFFGLAWIYHCTAWLPGSQALWQELILLRELRADRWAAQHTDPLLLAEALVLTAGLMAPPSRQPELCYAPALTAAGLEERVESLLRLPETGSQNFSWGLVLGLLPLLTIPWHLCCNHC